MRRTLLPLVMAACACAAPPPKPTAQPASAATRPRAKFMATTTPIATASPPPAAAASAAASPAEPAAPYALAADLEARKKAVRADSGAQTAFEVVQDVFLVAAPSGTLGSSAFVTRLALQAYFNHRFTYRPRAAVTVLLFDSAGPYDAFCQAHFSAPCWTPFGFYDPELRTVVLNAAPGIGTLTHELVHPIVESDFPGAPDWINEGIASLFEHFSFPKAGEIRGKKNFRLPALREALASETDRVHADLPALFAMGDKEFRGEREALNYATARYFCQWMDGQDKLWPFYQAWRDGRATDPTGEKAFEKVMGVTPAQANAGWVGWVRGL